MTKKRRQKIQIKKWMKKLSHPDFRWVEVGDRLLNALAKDAQNSEVRKLAALEIYERQHCDKKSEAEARYIFGWTTEMLWDMEKYFCHRRPIFGQAAATMFFDTLVLFNNQLYPAEIHTVPAPYTYGPPK